MELIVSVAPSRIEIENDVLSGPTAVRHNHRSRLHLVDLAVLRIHDRDCFRVPRFALVLYASGGRAEPDPHRLPGLVQLRKIDSAAVYSLDRVRAGNGMRNQCFCHMPAYAVVSSRKSKGVLTRAAVHRSPRDPAIRRNDIGSESPT